MGRVSRRVWEGYARLPGPVQRQTDRVIRVGARVSRRLNPFREESKRRGEAWVSNQKKKLGLSKKKKKGF